MNILEGNVTPVGMAAHLATYISDPSTIQAYVGTHFGERRAPSIERCRALRLKYEMKRQLDERHKLPMSTGFRCGHAYSEKNILWGMNGAEVCRTCHEAKQKEDAERKARIIERNFIPAKPAGKRPAIWSVTISAVADRMKISRADLLGEDRSQFLVDARAVLAMVMKASGLSYPQIARAMKRKCHSSIINLCRTFDKRCNRRPDLMAVYNELRQK